MSDTRTLHTIREQLAPAASTAFEAVRRTARLETTYGRIVRELANEVGGLNQLESLDDVALPDEPFDWSEVAPEDQPRAEEVLAVIDSVCQQWHDAEYGTIARRLFAMVLRNDPKPIRRSSSPRRIAAALVYAALAGNGELDRRTGRWATRDIAAQFETSPPADVARTLVRAAAIDPAYTDSGLGYEYHRSVHLGTSTLLHSRRRRELLVRRERLIQMCETEEERRAGRRPVVDLGDGRVQIRGYLADVAVVCAGRTGSGQSAVMLGLAPLVPEPELEMFALSLDEAHRLMTTLGEVLGEPSRLTPFPSVYDGPHGNYQSN